MTAIYVDPKLTAGATGMSRLSLPEIIARSLVKLDPEFLTVLDRVYGITSGTPLSVEDTASELGTTEDAIDSLHRNALRALFRR